MTDEEFKERWVSFLTYALLVLQASAVISLGLLIIRAITPFAWKWVASPILLGLITFVGAVVSVWAARSRRDFKKGLRDD